MGTVVHVPDIGDANDVEVIELCCAVGDTVEVGDPLIVLESDKASMEVPSEVAGTIVAFSVAVGDSVAEGQPICEIDTGASQDSADQSAQTEAAVDQAEAEGERDQETDQETDQESDRESKAGEVGDTGEAGDTAGGERVEVHVPDIGDASDVTVVEVCVSSGDTVAADDALVVLESDKASMEIGAPHAGTVVEIAVSEGDAVDEGMLVAVIETAGAAAPRGQSGGQRKADDQAQAQAKDDASGRPAGDSGAGAARKPAASRREPSAQPARAEAPAVGSNGPVYAGPAVRRMARELGVDLGRVQGSGARGRILKEDVQAWVKAQLSAATGVSNDGGAGIPPVPVPDFSKFGDIELEPLTRVMKVGAANLHRSWLNLPHVTHNDDADITDLEAFRASLKEEAAARDARLTPLAFIVKACVYALKAYPRFNASLDAAGDNFILKKYYNIGMAVDTPDGLMVPVIRAADSKSIWEIAADIIDLSERARDRKLRPDDMSGGTFSISSLGALGGTSFTPIINAPEVAILGVAKTATRPVWNGSEFVPRKMLPLSLSYDHRAINGADAARFTTTLVSVLSDIRRLALM